MKLAVCLCDPPDNVDISALAALTTLPVYTQMKDLPADCTHVLWVGAHGLALAGLGGKPATATRVDFLDGTLQYRLRTSGKRQGIGKAVGLDKAGGIHVLDATAGLGRDALVLAHLGCRVTMLERAPVMHALLDDGLRRARAVATDTLAATLARMALVHGDARQHLAALAQRADERPEVVYLDPMFPPRTKTALVKKDIALLQGLLGSAQDFPALLAAALACARHRVVVKRPGSKVEESGPRPTFVVPGKSAHFEVYVNSSFSSTR